MSLTVYTKDGCGFCVMLKKMLLKNEYDFTEINIDEDAAAKEFIISEGHKTMPQVYEGDSIFVEGGFDGMRKYISEQELKNTDLGSI